MCHAWLGERIRSFRIQVLPCLLVVFFPLHLPLASEQHCTHVVSVMWPESWKLWVDLPGKFISLLRQTHFSFRPKMSTCTKYFKWNAIWAVGRNAGRTCLGECLLFMPCQSPLALLPSSFACCGLVVVCIKSWSPWTGMYVCMYCYLY